MQRPLKKKKVFRKKNKKMGAAVTWQAALGYDLWPTGDRWSLLAAGRGCPSYDHWSPRLRTTSARQPGYRGLIHGRRLLVGVWLATGDR
jgi:hypothetical protein